MFLPFRKTIITIRLLLKCNLKKNLVAKISLPFCCISVFAKYLSYFFIRNVLIFITYNCLVYLTLNVVLCNDYVYVNCLK